VLPSLEEVKIQVDVNFAFVLYILITLIFYCNEKVSKIRGERTGRVGDSDARLLVHQSQIGCIIGRGGAKVKELREVLRTKHLSYQSLMLSLAFTFRHLLHSHSCSS
jgi:predicted RNA-binding protein YlqC (UPF0109 family)